MTQRENDSSFNVTHLLSDPKMIPGTHGIGKCVSEERKHHETLMLKSSEHDLSFVTMEEDVSQNKKTINWRESL